MVAVPAPLIAVASRNPVKIAAAKQLLAYREFQFQPVDVPSGVSAQPMSDEETLVGAVTRAHNALTAVLGAQYGLGIEGGCRNEHQCLTTFAYCVIIDRQGHHGHAKSAEFLIPPAVSDLILAGGLELGHAMDRVYGHENSKQSMGASGILTDGRIDRAELYRHAVLAAYIPFLRPDEYWPR